MHVFDALSRVQSFCQVVVMFVFCEWFRFEFLPLRLQLMCLRLLCPMIAVAACIYLYAKFRRKKFIYTQAHNMQMIFWHRWRNISPLLLLELWLLIMCCENWQTVQVIDSIYFIIWKFCYNVISRFVIHPYSLLWQVVRICIFPFFVTSSLR